jgi:hypothetical protein
MELYRQHFIAVVGLLGIPKIVGAIYPTNHSLGVKSTIALPREKNLSGVLIVH